MCSVFKICESIIKIILTYALNRGYLLVCKYAEVSK